MESIKGKLIAIVRVRGHVKVSSDIEETMKRLRLNHVNNCTVVKMDGSYFGMLDKCKNHVTYGEIDEATLKSLLAKFLPEVDPKEVLSGKKPMSDLKESMPFRLHPPRRGYRPIKLSYAQKGAQSGCGQMSRVQICPLHTKVFIFIRCI